MRILQTGRLLYCQSSLFQAGRGVCYPHTAGYIDPEIVPKSLLDFFLKHAECIKFGTIPIEY